MLAVRTAPVGVWTVALGVLHIHGSTRTRIPIMSTQAPGDTVPVALRHFLVGTLHALRNYHENFLISGSGSGCTVYG